MPGSFSGLNNSIDLNRNRRAKGPTLGGIGFGYLSSRGFF